MNRTRTKYGVDLCFSLRDAQYAAALHEPAQTQMPLSPAPDLLTYSTVYVQHYHQRTILIL